MTDAAGLYNELRPLLKSPKPPDKDGRIWSFCPCHADGSKHGRRSLSLHPVYGLDCFAGCEFSAILAALGARRDGQRPSDVEATYTYRAEDGVPLFEVCRLPGKRFAQRRPGADTWGIQGVRRVLYRLPEVLAADPEARVFICEGEKDADNLAALDLAATTNPGGASKWRREYSEALRDRRVCVLPDADPPGHAHALKVAESLRGVAAEVRILALPGLGDKQDASDWVAGGGTAEELLRLAASAPVWQPSKPLLPKGLSLTPLSDLLAEPAESIPWLVDKMLPAGGLSLLGGKPKVGKSTLARNLALAVARGEPFLGRDTAAGPVVYLGLEEKRGEVQAHFARMGASDEVIFVHVGGAPEEALLALRTAIEEHGAKLAIVDPLLRFIRLRDGNDYAEVTAALEPLLLLARETGCHILVCHHLGKMERDGGDAILGSTALFGSVDTALLLRRREGGRVAGTIQRYGVDLPPTLLGFDVETGITSAGLPVAEAELAQAGEGVLEAVKEGPLTEPEIKEAVGGNNLLTQKAIRKLLADGLLTREGQGRKGDPYRYGLSATPPHSHFLTSPIGISEQSEKSEHLPESEEAAERGRQGDSHFLTCSLGGSEQNEKRGEPENGPETFMGDCPSCDRYAYIVGGVCNRCGAEVTA